MPDLLYSSYSGATSTVLVRVGAFPPLCAFSMNFKTGSDAVPGEARGGWVPAPGRPSLRTERDLCKVRSRTRFSAPYCGTIAILISKKMAAADGQKQQQQKNQFHDSRSESTTGTRPRVATLVVQYRSY